jgi:hypothetical protein
MQSTGILGSPVPLISVFPGFSHTALSETEDDDEHPVYRPQRPAFYSRDGTLNRSYIRLMCKEEGGK